MGFLIALGLIIWAFTFGPVVGLLVLIFLALLMGR